LHPHGNKAAVSGDYPICKSLLGKIMTFTIDMNNIHLIDPAANKVV
jgi:hypothetical protein